jgi:hypothetical protein
MKAVNVEEVVTAVNRLISEPRPQPSLERRLL